MGDGNGVGGRNDSAAPTHAERWGQHGRVIVGLATAAFWVALKDSEGDKSQVVAPPKTVTHQPAVQQLTSDQPGGAAAMEAAAGTEFSDVVTIDFGTGYDLDGGTASSARHSASHRSRPSHR